MADHELVSILKTALVRETAAHDFYAAIAEKTSRPAVKEIFERLAADERGHEKLIKKLMDDPQLASRLSAPEVDFGVAESTAIEPLSLDLSPAEAIALAMKKEQGAVQLYRSLAASALVPDVKALFERLAGMELGHKQALENIYTDIGFAEVF